MRLKRELIGLGSVRVDATDTTAVHRASKMAPKIAYLWSSWGELSWALAGELCRANTFSGSAVQPLAFEAGCEGHIELPRRSTDSSCDNILKWLAYTRHAAHCNPHANSSSTQSLTWWNHCRPPLSFLKLSSFICSTERRAYDVCISCVLSRSEHDYARRSGGNRSKH